MSAHVPPWIRRQLQDLLQRRGHALLLQGPSGLGQYALALELARASLCEQVSGQGACGQCPSCHAIEVRTHADLCVLMPEETMLELGWPLSEKAQAEIDDKKRKPSKEIRIDAMREAIEFTQRTSARGRGKVVLVFPAERMNHVTANALLKTLEEPPGELHFVLASEAAHQLLPTVRSRCQGHGMEWPQPSEATAWLQSQGLSESDASGLLLAAGGRPDDALGYFQSGHSAQAWFLLPEALLRGDDAMFKDFTAAQLVQMLHKLCHDLLALAQGAQPRFFEQNCLPLGADFARLSDWSRELGRAARTIEHPFNPGLLQQDLLSQARQRLAGAR